VEELTGKKIIGLMSGTSCDSIDAGLCLVSPDLSCKLIASLNYPYPPHIQSKLFQAFSSQLSIKDICELNFLIGHCFAEAANSLISQYGKPDFIASHGQTIFHNPTANSLDNFPLASTLQLGESAVIAHKTGCDVFSDFRTADIALGGQGAPLVSFADEKWFKNSAVQNIGGISNVTVVSDNLQTFAFDNGVGNLFLDYCANKFFSSPCDFNGEFAQAGNISESWLDCLLQDEYYFLSPPKTTGREYFSINYIENMLKFAPENPHDIMATLSALTAKSIALSYERFVYPNTAINQVIVGGGGAYNPFLLKLLRTYLPSHIDLKTHEDFGISNNFKEAMAFALLGYCSFYNIPNNLPSCTGASKRCVLGKLTKAI